MMELLQYEFVRNTIIAGILANITYCIIGVYAMVQKIIFIGGRTWLSCCLMWSLDMIFIMSAVPTQFSLVKGIGSRAHNVIAL